MKMLFLVPFFALGLTLIGDYLLPEMPKRKRIIILCIIALFSVLLGLSAVFFMFSSYS